MLSSGFLLPVFFFFTLTLAVSPTRRPHLQNSGASSLVIIQGNMVHTRSQTKAGHSYYGKSGESTEKSSDSEVSFNTRWLDYPLLGQPHSPLSALSQAADDTDSEIAEHNDRQERRLRILESAVMGIIEKFDSLLLQLGNAQTQRTPERERSHRRRQRDRDGDTGTAAMTQPAAMTRRGAMTLKNRDLLH